MPLQGHDFLDLGGGVNRGESPANLAKNQAVELENWYPVETLLRRRGGTRLVTTNSAWDVNITSMIPVKRSTGDWSLIVGGTNKFGYLNGDRISNISFASGVTCSTSTLPWSFVIYKNYVYALREGDRVFRLKWDESAKYAGIAKPLTAPIAAANASGSLTAGTYKTVYTYANSATAVESNPSEPSTVVLTTGQSIDHSGLVASSDPFVDTIYVYRTLVDQEEVYFRVGTVVNGTTTLSAETLPAALMGRAVRFDNNQPPQDAIAAAIWRERMWAPSKTEMNYSNIGNVEGFGDEASLAVNPDDSHEIRGVCPVASGERLVVGKTNTTWYITGSGPGSFVVGRLHEKIGVRSHHSMQSVGNTIFWFGSGKGVYRADGGQVSEIGNPEVKAILEAIPDDLEKTVIGTLFPQLNWYCLSVPQTSFTTNRKLLVYNYVKNTWSVFTHSSNAPQFLLQLFTVDFGEQLYATFYDGHLYKYNDATYPTDNGTAISAVWGMKPDDFGAPGYQKWIHEVWLAVPNDITGSLRFQVFKDNNPTAIVDRTVSVYEAADLAFWKAYKMGESAGMGSKLRLRVTYTGDTAIDLNGVHVEVGLTARRPARPR